MKTPSQRFVRGWAITCVVLLAGVAAVNAFVDPYLLFNMPRLKGFNQRKPGVETHERMMKAYEVLRAAPNGLILGTSRVAIGLDTAHASWPARARPVYNLGLAGADPYTSYRYLQHVLSQREATVVVLGLDFEYFLTGKKRDPSAPMGFEAYLNVDRDGQASPMRSWQTLRDWTEGTLSLEALGDSITTVTSTIRGQTLDVSPSGNLSEAGFRRETEEIGSGPLFAQRNRYNIRTYRGRVFSQDGAGQADAPALADLRAIVALCRARAIQLELFIQPMHADLLETLDLLGVWPAYETWKREMVAVSHGPARSAGAAVARLWDFSDYDRFSTESLPADGDRRTHLQWFWEPTHYTKALGDIILTRIFGGRDTGYGVALTAETVDARLAEIREHRRIYRERHPEAVRRVRAVYDSASP
jgi:hypothetical protein